MSTLDDWITDTCGALGLPPDSITHERRDELLDLTRDVARGVARIAGPLTTYLIGMAVAGGIPPSTAIGRVAELAAAHTGEDDGDGAARCAASDGGGGSHRSHRHEDPAT